MPDKHKERTILFDLRCLQDPNYAPRGVGRHALSLLKGAPREAAGLRLVGLTDAALPALGDDVRRLFDEIHINGYSASLAKTSELGGAFVSLSPMTDDPLFCARLVADPTLRKIAVVYDFIPTRHPARYLPTAADRLDYAVQLRWLASCNLFCPISRSAGDDLMALLNVPRRAVVVTGAAVDPAFERTTLLDAKPRSGILVVGGGDPRKNPEAVIRAHATSAQLQEKAIRLIVAGNYGPGPAGEFRKLAADLGGRADLLSVPGHISEEALVALYAEASVLVCASRDEGFSLPVVEGMAAGAVVLASEIPAHNELVTDPTRRFPADDHVALGRLLDRAVVDTAWRRQALRAQAAVWPQFRASEVSGRFWKAVLSSMEVREPVRSLSAPTVLRRRRPRVAMLTPLPPDRSGVADYSAATCPELGELVDLHVFTETVAPGIVPGATTVRPLEALPLLMPEFDRVIGVIGNSHFHLRIFEFMRRYGGAIIAHDARMLGFYVALLGEQRARDEASKELGRPVSAADIEGWMMDERTLEALFLGEIAACATPAIVHSPITVRLMKQRYGVAPCYLPFSIYRPWSVEELTAPRRAEARARLGLANGELAIATFGYVHSTKAAMECIWAVDFLNAWGISASLHFVGSTAGMPPDELVELHALVKALGLTGKVRVISEFVSERMYRDYLVGANLGIQLRTYGLGGLSGALLDCVAAGLPTVSNDRLAEAVGVPDGCVALVPDILDPLRIAEACAGLIESGKSRESLEPQRARFSDDRSFRTYTRNLCNALGLEVGSVSASVRQRVA